jgi:hypothetical protein
MEQIGDTLTANGESCNNIKGISQTKIGRGGAMYLVDINDIAWFLLV